MLKFDKKVLEGLKLKYSTSEEVQKNSLLHAQIDKIPKRYFNDIDDIMLGRPAPLTKGSDGPSRVDSDHFRCMLFEQNLRERIALLARTLA